MPDEGLDAEAIARAFSWHMTYTVAKDGYTATAFDVYRALAHVVRDRVVGRWFQTQSAYYRADARRVYYLSLEFLIGRSLLAHLDNLGARDATRRAMAGMGYDLEALADLESDPGLGHGGLGRLAACMMDSAATLALPVFGYGIRYEYGIFRQHIEDGRQVEAPDNWLRYGSPWEIPRPDALYPVRFGGRLERIPDETGRVNVRWVDTERVLAMAHDVPVPGYRNGTVNSLRLWAAKSTREFDLGQFNAGEWVRAVEDKDRTESISKVLYPPDDRYAGKELRLRQQYFFVSATLQDIVRRFRKVHGDWGALPDRVAVQMNETHPSLAIPELMRVLVDDEGLEWAPAWAITRRVFAYTNHTILPEALEVWPAELMGRLLPRHLDLIEEIDRRFRAEVRARHPGDEARVRRMAIVTDGDDRQVRMAHLAVVGSHRVNGVSRLHTEILTRSILGDFHDLDPGRFGNVTNGVSPRRWLLTCHPRLAALVTEAIGDRWTRDLEALSDLRPLADDPGFRQRWRAVKRAAKVALADLVRGRQGLRLDPDSLFDCQAKRIHEYKRQLLNVLHVLARAARIRAGSDDGEPSRTVILAGKAAPGYTMAKLVIELTHRVAAVVEADARVAARLRLVFLENFEVSLAERLVPALDLSQHISTAGTEASGTGNMKAVLNGGVLLGTRDGANVEIAEAVGAEAVFLFGHDAAELAALRAGGYRPRAWADRDPELAGVLAALTGGLGGDAGRFRPLADSVLDGDRYFVCADFGPYLAAQRAAGLAYGDPEGWARRSILSMAGAGRFSSDRTVRDYAGDVWQATPVPSR